jgi:hypothetical protein
MAPCRQPVIILGMHRSGTSIVARLLDELGLFQGKKLEENHESTFFLRANDALMRQIHCGWDHPAPMRQFLELSDAVALTVASLERFVASAHAVKYLGMRKMLRYRSVYGLPCPWGWKDPRTIFTLPLWLRLFPRARLIYIRRNGLDVAASLMTRERERLARRRARFAYPRLWGSTRTALTRLGFKGSARCLTFEGAFSLWEEYVAEAERHLATFPNDRLVISYEDLTAAPQEHLAALTTFAGLDCRQADVAEAARAVRPARARSPYRAIGSLDDSSDPPESRDRQTARASTSIWMRRYGYDALINREPSPSPAPAD